MFAPEGKPVYLVILFASLAFLTNFQDSYSNSYMNTAYNGFVDYFNGSYIHRGKTHGLSKWQFTWIWSVFLDLMPFGFLFGTLICPYLSDTYGRRMSLILAAIVSLFGTSLSVIAVIVKWPEMILVARAIASFSSGVSYIVLVIFIQETSPTSLRGTCSFLVEITFVGIRVLGFAFGLDALLGHHIDLLIGVGLIPGVLAILIMFPLKETPKYLLINKNDRNSAIEALAYYQGDSSKTQELLDIMLKEAEEEKIDLPLRKALVEIFRAVHLRKALIIGVLAFQLITPSWTLLYLSSILLEDNFSNEVSQYISFAFVTIQFAACLAGVGFIDRYGRRPMLLISSILNTLTLVTYVAFDRLAHYQGGWYKYGCVASLIAYGITYGAAVGPISCFISTELAPQQFRSLIQATVLAINTVIAIVLTFGVLPLYNLMDIWVFIPVYVIPAIGCIAYIGYILPETKGKEIYQIVEDLKETQQLDIKQMSDENEEKANNYVKDLIVVQL